MTSKGIGWHFPPTSGGTYDGYNDPGIAHFDGAHEESLARETLQNSLDAREGDKPVEVEFVVTDLDIDSLGQRELRQAVTACLDEPELSEKAKFSLTEARDILAKTSLKALRISDWNTTGLRGHQWTALVKARGMNIKQGPGAGGSHGIGKFAPFVVSPLRTVFYWTRFQESSEIHELFQGRSVLMSHSLDGEEKQGTGYFGQIDQCKELRDNDIPQSMHPNDDRFGTTLWVAGFSDDKRWWKRIARSVLTSFFGAIEDGALAIWIDPGSNQDTEQDELSVIDRDSIRKWFEYLVADDDESEEREESSIEELVEASKFWELLLGQPVAERQFPNVGYCRLWIRVVDGLPSKVALMRKTGMMVTTNQPRLQRFPGLSDFIAICRFEGDEGNELLRRMENPTHDRFEPDRLPPDERRRGRAALKRVTDWIRGELREVAGPPPYEKHVDLDELRLLLPDIEAEDAFGSDQEDVDGDQELSFGGSAIVRPKPRRRPSYRFEFENGEGGGSGGDDDEGDEHNGGGGGSGTGGGDDGPGGGGSNSNRRERIGIKDVRLVRGVSGNYRVSFTPLEGGVATIAIQEAGDSSKLDRPDVKATDATGTLSLSNMQLTPEKRVEFEIEAVDPIADRAWIISAFKRSE